MPRGDPSGDIESTLSALIPLIDHHYYDQHHVQIQFHKTMIDSQLPIALSLDKRVCILGHEHPWKPKRDCYLRRPARESVHCQLIVLSYSYGPPLSYRRGRMVWIPRLCCAGSFCNAKGKPHPEAISNIMTFLHSCSSQQIHGGFWWKFPSLKTCSFCPRRPRSRTYTVVQLPSHLD